MQVIHCAVTDILVRKCITFENSSIVIAISSLFVQSITNRVQISYKLAPTLTDVFLLLVTVIYDPLVVLCNENTITVILVWETARPAAVLYVN